jgi:hypothetical protein
LFLDFSRKISLKGLHEISWSGMSSVVFSHRKSNRTTRKDRHVLLDICDFLQVVFWKEKQQRATGSCPAYLVIIFVRFHSFPDITKSI